MGVPCCWLILGLTSSHKVCARKTELNPRMGCMHWDKRGWSFANHAVLFSTPLCCAVPQDVALGDVEVPGQYLSVMSWTVTLCCAAPPLPPRCCAG
jgi:hypothetical protein